MSNFETVNEKIIRSFRGIPWNWPQIKEVLFAGLAGAISRIHHPRKRLVFPDHWPGRLWSPDTCECLIGYTYDPTTIGHFLHVHWVDNVVYCGGDHPQPVMGYPVEMSLFWLHHILINRRPI